MKPSPRSRPLRRCKTRIARLRPLWRPPSQPRCPPAVGQLRLRRLGCRTDRPLFQSRYPFAAAEMAGYSPKLRVSVTLSCCAAETKPARRMQTARSRKLRSLLLRSERAQKYGTVQTTYSAPDFKLSGLKPGGSPTAVHTLRR